MFRTAATGQLEQQCGLEAAVAAAHLLLTRVTLAQATHQLLNTPSCQSLGPHGATNNVPRAAPPTPQTSLICGWGAKANTPPEPQALGPMAQNLTGPSNTSPPYRAPWPRLRVHDTQVAGAVNRALEIGVGSTERNTLSVDTRWPSAVQLLWLSRTTCIHTHKERFGRHIKWLSC